MIFCCRYAGRFDCGCVYEMKCELLNEKKEPLTDFKCRKSVKQWEGRTWHKVNILVTSVRLGAPCRSGECILSQRLF
jgi:hypothetical protein